MPNFVAFVSAVLPAVKQFTVQNYGTLVLYNFKVLLCTITAVCRVQVNKNGRKNHTFDILLCFRVYHLMYEV